MQSVHTSTPPFLPPSPLSLLQGDLPVGAVFVLLLDGLLGALIVDLLHGALAVANGHQETTVGRLNQLGAECGDDELGLLALLGDPEGGRNSQTQ